MPDRSNEAWGARATFVYESACRLDSRTLWWLLWSLAVHELRTDDAAALAREIARAAPGVPPDGP